MGTRRTLRVDLEFDVKGDAELKGVSSELRDVARAGGEAERGMRQASDGASSGSLRFTELAGKISVAQAAFQAVGDVARVAYENISEGAQLELARSQFDNLAGSINTTADSLLNNLRDATKGMVSDAELIAGATDIINLGLADTQEETVRLATAVSTLGLDMQQVILTFANNSTARLDALGLSIEDVTTKAAELEAQGFTGDAFDEAVLIGLEEKMRLLGDASETTAGQLQILESDWANLTDSLKQGAAEIAGPVLRTIVSNRQEAAKLREIYQQGTITYLEYQKALTGISQEGKTVETVFLELGLTMEGLTETQAIAIERSEKQAIAMGLGAAAADAAAQEIIALSQAAADAAGPNEELNDKLAQTNNLLNEEEAALARARGELNQIQAAAGEAASGIDDFGGSLEDSAGPAANMVSLTDAINARLAALGKRHDFLLNLDVAGLEGLKEAISIAGGFMTENINPFATQGDRTFGDEFVVNPDAGFARGISDFIVPPGFPNDSFLMGLTSGETVNVTPAGETVNNNSSVSIIQNINGGPDTAAQARDGVMEALTAAGLKGFG